MICIVTTARHGYTHRAVREALGSDRVQLLDWGGFLAARRLPRASFILTDFDRLAPPVLQQAAHRYRLLREQTDCRLLNDPARCLQRYGLLRLLHREGWNDFDVHRVDEAPALDRLRYPVFLRNETDHAPPLSDLLDGRKALKQAIEAALAAGHPGSQLLIVEYRGEPADGPHFRRIGAYRIGDRIVAAEHVHDTHWCVKFGQAGNATTALYEAEYDTVTANPYADQLFRIFERAGIEYGRADFSFVGGRMQVYEINTNPMVTEPTDHPIARRRESMAVVWENYRSALAALDA